MIFEQYVKFNSEVYIVMGLFLPVLSIFITTTIEQTLAYPLTIKHKNHMYMSVLLSG